jgi:phosphoserine phosphatase
MLRIFLIRPGCTDFDEQGRIKGTLNIPLNAHGTDQAAKWPGELGNAAIEMVYTSPAQSAVETAATLGHRLNLKYKILDQLQNLDHGLWHGRLIEEVRQRQPKVYRLWQAHPESMCPPDGETLASAQQRVRQTMKRLQKKHKHGVIGLVVPDPLASILRSCVEQTELGDLWKAECDFGGWQLLDVPWPQTTTV